MSESHAIEAIETSVPLGGASTGARTDLGILQHQLVGGDERLELVRAQAAISRRELEMPDDLQQAYYGGYATSHYQQYMGCKSSAKWHSNQQVGNTCH